jgi:hypothetical protein
MIIVNPLHWYHRPQHLEHVKSEMLKRGVPTIRAHFDGQIWHAQEGTHRLRACLALGLVPRLVHVPWPKTKAALIRAQIAAKRNAHIFVQAQN